jgi:hypothetical protein
MCNDGAIVMARVQGLSDKAVAVFAFAAYHQLESGQTVSSVVRQDGSGHHAGEDAVTELAHRGLIRVEGRHLHLTADGEGALQKAVAALRRVLEKER